MFQQYAKQMYNVAFRIVGNSFEAEDAVQESFIKAFQKISSFKGESTFGAWLKRIVVNQSISIVRNNKHHHFSIDEVKGVNAIIEEEIEIAETVPMAKVHEAIDNLPEGARLVFTLKAIEEYKFREIAEMLSITESNCKVQYHRSKKILNDKLKVVLESNL